MKAMARSAILVLVLASSLSACTAYRECQPMTDRAGESASCPSTAVVGGGSYLVTGACLERGIIRERLQLGEGDTTTTVRRIAGVSPADAVALLKGERGCRWTYAYYYKLSKAQLQQFAALPTHPPPNDSVTSE